jgi:hypothetical protein
MQMYVTITSYTCLGTVIATGSVRTRTQEGKQEVLYRCSTEWQDDGTDDPQEHLRGVLSGLLEYVYDDTPRTMSTWGASGG